jgi:arylsulfatase A-like enzyme
MMLNRNHPSRILLLAIWYGLLTGFVEAILWGIKRLYLGQFIRLGPHIVWMAPLAEVILFLVPGFILYVIAMRAPEKVSDSLVHHVFGFLAFLSLLFMYYPIHPYAKVVLAAGLTVQAVRIIAKRRELFATIVKRTLPVMAVLMLVLAIGFDLWPWIQVRQAVAQLPPNAPNAPNVLLIVLDTVGSQNLSLYGYGRETTPNLERWAKNSVVFDNATSTAPWTLPSHGSMFTGRWPHELSADWEESFDGKYPTLAEFLTKQGYITAGIVANTQYMGYEFGFDRGFTEYDDYIASPRELLISSVLGQTIANSRLTRRVLGYHDNIPRKNAAQVNDLFFDWLDGTDHRPFFAFLNYFDAHASYHPPEPFTEKFGPNNARGNERMVQDIRQSKFDDWYTRPKEEIKVELDMYDGAIAYIDDQLNQLQLELERRGILENTIVIITSDHGEQFGEHDFYVHANSLYKPLLQVPLMISFPRSVPADKRIAARVSLRDIPATVLDLIGLAGTGTFPGQSLARYWSGSSPDPTQANLVLAEVRKATWALQRYPTAIGDMQALLDDDYHYIKNADGREELYALDKDPGEQHDLSRSDEGAALLKHYRAKLNEFLSSNSN